MDAARQAFATFSSMAVTITIVMSSLDLFASTVLFITYYLSRNAEIHMIQHFYVIR